MRANLVMALLLLAGCGDQFFVDPSPAEDVGGGEAGNGGSTGGTGGEGAGDVDPPGPDCDIGEPLSVPADTWTWVSFDDAYCGYQGNAAIVVNPSLTSRNLLVVLDGGGACFHEGDCASSFLDGVNEFDIHGIIEHVALFDRLSTHNPFADWSYVFVPYCTGDFHSGSRTAEYGVRHVGYANMQRFLTRIVPTFCDAEQVVLTGVSAGGFGATFNYVQVHEAFDGVPVDLIDDSGPYMQPPFMPSDTQAAIDDNWGFRANMPADCEGCQESWHALYTHAAERYPEDRISLVSALYDYSIQERFAPYTPLQTLDDFEPAINALADDVLVPLPNARVFYVNDSGHVYTYAPLHGLVVGDTSLEQFVRAQIDDDPSWSNVRP